MKKPYQFQFSRNAERDFAILEKSLQKKILKKLEFFANSEHLMLFAKKLVGFEDRFRFRIGDYRVIVAVKDQNTLIILLILKIGHRREIYE